MEKSLNKDCTFLFSTYDGGEDLWEGFFKALSVQWPEMDMKIVMNTETKRYSYKGYIIESYQPCLKKKMTWAERLVETLSHVETEFVLFFLEDFWLDSRVDDLFFRQTLLWMKDNPDVANFSYYPCKPESNIQDDRFDRFELRPQVCEYKFNCQVGLWRTKEFMSFFRKHENPWEWEVFGSIRAGKCFQKFYSLKPDSQKIFSYGDSYYGCIIHRGKWVKEAVLPLAEKYGLSLDYSKRGFEDFDEYFRFSNYPKWRKVLSPYIFKELYLRQYNKYRRWLSVREEK